MAKAPSKTVDQVQVHPDDLLLQQWADAQAVITAYAARVEAVAAALMALESQASPEDIQAAKDRLNAWLANEYPNKSARRGVAMDIDIDGFELPTHDLGDIAPAMLEKAKEVLAGKILVSGTESMYRAIVNYVCSARDEDGSPVLLGYQQQSIHNLFFPPAAAPVRVTRTKKEKVEGAVSASNGTTAIGVKVCQWPGTNISAKVSEFGDGKIRVQGRAKANLMDALAKSGITVTKEMIDKTMAEVYKNT